MGREEITGSASNIAVSGRRLDHDPAVEQEGIRYVWENASNPRSIENVGENNFDIQNKPPRNYNCNVIIPALNGIPDLKSVLSRKEEFSCDQDKDQLIQRVLGKWQQLGLFNEKFYHHILGFLNRCNRTDAFASVYSQIKKEKNVLHVERAFISWESIGSGVIVAGLVLCLTKVLLGGFYLPIAIVVGLVCWIGVGIARKISLQKQQAVDYQLLFGLFAFIFFCNKEINKEDAFRAMEQIKVELKKLFSCEKSYLTSPICRAISEIHEILNITNQNTSTGHS